MIIFFVLWSISLYSSLAHIKKGPEYLTRDTAQVFSPLIRFLQDSFVSSSFLVLLGYYYYSLWVLTTDLSAGISKQSLQISETHLRIPIDSSSAVVWMISILHTVSCSSGYLQVPVDHSKGNKSYWYNHQLHVDSFFYSFVRLFFLAFRFYFYSMVKAGDVSRGWPEGSLFDSYYTTV